MCSRTARTSQEIKRKLKFRSEIITFEFAQIKEKDSFTYHFLHCSCKCFNSGQGASRMAVVLPKLGKIQNNK